jgi:hypothetical protein
MNKENNTAAIAVPTAEIVAINAIFPSENYL